MPKFAVLSTLEGPAGIANVIVADTLEIAQEVTKLRCAQLPEDYTADHVFDGEKFVLPEPTVSEEETNA